MIAALIILGVSAVGFGAWFVTPTGATPPDDRVMPAKSDTAQLFAEAASGGAIDERLRSGLLDPQGPARSIGARLMLVGRGRKPREPRHVERILGRFTFKIPRETAGANAFARSIRSGLRYPTSPRSLGLSPGSGRSELRLVKDQR